jgi:hypothetical protein
MWCRHASGTEWVQATEQFDLARTRFTQAMSSIERLGETLKCGVVAFGVLAIANPMPHLT